MSFSDTDSTSAKRSKLVFVNACQRLRPSALFCLLPLLVKSGEKPAPVASSNNLPNKEGAETGSQALSGQTAGPAVPVALAL